MKSPQYPYFKPFNKTYLDHEKTFLSLTDGSGCATIMWLKLYDLSFCFSRAKPIKTVLLDLKHPNMLNIAALGIYMLLSTMSNDNTAATIQPVTVPTVVETKTDSDAKVDKDVEAQVRNYFSDTPILAEVARCESHFTQFTDSGNVLRGKVVRADVGVMQINEDYHLTEAKKLGYDIYTLEGNMAFAKYLYSKNGARDWLASSKCWSTSGEIAKK